MYSTAQHSTIVEVSLQQQQQLVMLLVGEDHHHHRVLCCCCQKNHTHTHETRVTVCRTWLEVNKLSISLFKSVQCVDAIFSVFYSPPPGSACGQQQQQQQLKEKKGEELVKKVLAINGTADDGLSLTVLVCVRFPE